MIHFFFLAVVVKLWLTLLLILYLLFITVYVIIYVWSALVSNFLAAAIKRVYSLRFILLIQKVVKLLLEHTFSLGLFSLEKLNL